MTFTITVRKLHLAIAVLAVAVLAPATAALADHVFVDVSDRKFYAEPIQWAADNDITTGSPAGSDTFKPEDPVTRGESVTFLKRYHDNLAQPAIAANTSAAADNAADIAELASRLTTAEANIAANTSAAADNTADIAELGAAMPFVTTSYEPSSQTRLGGEDLTLTPTAYVTVTVTAPVAGHVTVDSTAVVRHVDGGGDVRCQIVESTAIPAVDIATSNGPTVESTQWFETDSVATSDYGSLSGTRTFSIAAGATVDYVLACEEADDLNGIIYGRNLTAIFTPAP